MNVTVCAHETFGRLGFLSNAVKTYCTTNEHEIACTDDVITAMNYLKERPRQVTALPCLFTSKQKPHLETCQFDDITRIQM